MPSDIELSKKSDEHKALLAQKCVDLLMRKTGSQDELAEVRKYREMWLMHEFYNRIDTHEIIL